MKNISPPSDVFIEIRVKKEIGSIITRDGEELDLSEGN
jgi:molybdopterin-binding protein